MRTLTVIMGCLLAANAVAVEFPQTSDPLEQSYIARYKQDRPRLESPDLFAFPASTPAWPCEVPQIEQYRLAGLNMAHPELSKDIEKQTRKLFRAQGMSPDSIPVTTYSNIRIVPVKAQCSAGKLSGELVLLVAYDSLMETRIAAASGNQVSRIRSQAVKRSEQRIDASKENLAAAHFTRTTTFITTDNDNPQMDAMSKKLGFKNAEPSTIISVNYMGAFGTLASFTEMNTGPAGIQLLSSFIVNPTEQSGRHSNYLDQKLTTITPTREGLPHGEQFTYMDNFAKKSNLKLDKIPGMENAREVTLNGVDLIEKRQCFQNGQMVMISPCPAN